MNKVGGWSPRHISKEALHSHGSNEFILKAVWNKIPVYLLLSQVFNNNLTNHLPVNVQFTLYQLYGHLMVSGYQFKKLLKLLLDFEQLMAAHSSIMFKVLTSLFKGMHTKYIFISTVSSILCSNIHLCCSMTTHKNATYVMGCYRLIDLELLSLIPQGYNKNRYHCNFFLYGSLPLCLLLNKPYYFSLNTTHVYFNSNGYPYNKT